MTRRMEPGERGEVWYQAAAGGVRAVQYYRDHVRRLRKGKGSGPTKVAARRRLKRNVDNALAIGGAGYTPSTKFELAVEEFLTGVQRAVQQGSRSPTTYDTYERSARVHVIPALGKLRLAEVTVGRLDTFLGQVHERVGYATAKTCRTILNGTCAMLARRDILRVNPMNNVGRLERGSRKAPRALSVAEVHALLDVLDASEFAVRKDLPDLVRFMLATGVRVGEALAVRWRDVDLDVGIVIVEATVVRVRGRGLVRKATKSDASDRTLRLPGWCVGLLARRYVGQTPDAPVFPDSRGGWRDRSNVGRDLRSVRAGTAYEWVTSHTARRTVATVLDIDGMSARAIADQLGHARPSMTQDAYMGRRVVGENAVHLEALGNAQKDAAREPGSTAG